MSNAGKELCLRKEEVLIIGKHLCEVDISIMREFVIKQVEETEHHVSCYSSRLALWKHIKTTTSFVKILEYFLTSFLSLMIAVVQVLNDLLIFFPPGTRHHSAFGF